jgi:hypothetical protein
MIPGAVGADFQSGAFDLLPEPAARGKMRLAECGTVHAAIAGRADLGEFVERSQHALGMDAELRDWFHHLQNHILPLVSSIN